MKLIAFARLSVCVCFAFLLGEASSRGAEPGLPALPASNPYAPAYAAFERLTHVDREALAAKKPLSAEAAPIIAEVTRALAAGRGAESVDWGLNYDAGAAMSFQHLLSIRHLSGVALVSADQLAPGELVERALDVMALARHAGRENFVITLMMERALEQQAATSLQNNMPRLSSADAQRLLAEMDKLPPGGDFAGALEIEKAFFADALLNDVRAALGSEDEKDAAPGGAVGPLRMTGIVSEGRMSLIGFELEGEAFWLKPGQSRNGVTLLSVDPKTDQALLMHRKQMVRLRLSSKQIATLNLERLADAIKNAGPGSALRMLSAADVKENGAEFVRMLELTATQLSDLYAEATAHPERFADADAFNLRLQALTPMAQLTAGWLPPFIKSEKRAAQRAVELRAALIARTQPPAQK